MKLRCVWLIENFNNPCCEECLVLQQRWTSTWSSLPVIDKTSSSGFAVCLVSRSEKQHSLAIWLRSSRCPSLLSCLSIWTRWCVSFCSGMCVVWAVVTKLFAFVRICMGTISPLTSAQKPLRNQARFKTLHACVLFSNSGWLSCCCYLMALTANDGTSCCYVRTGWSVCMLIFSITVRSVCVSCWQFAVFSQENDMCTLKRLIAVVMIGGIGHAKNTLLSRKWPKTSVNILTLEGTNNLVDFSDIPDSRISSDRGTTRKLITKMDLRSTLQTIEPSENRTICSINIKL